MPDDVVIADIAGQALDIFLYGPESAHKNGIVKTNIRSHMHSYLPMRTPKANEGQNPPKADVSRSSFTGTLLVQCAGGRRPGSLALASRDFSTSEAFSPRTVLTENICRCVQQILQHRPATMPFLTISNNLHNNLFLPGFSSFLG